MKEVAILIFGIAGGMGIYRLFLALVLDKYHFTACDYCEYKRKKK